MVLPETESRPLIAKPLFPLDFEMRHGEQSVNGEAWRPFRLRSAYHVPPSASAPGTPVPIRHRGAVPKRINLHLAERGNCTGVRAAYASICALTVLSML